MPLLSPSLRAAIAGGLLLALTPLAAPAQTYTWKNVVIRGGGYVSGLLFHPTRQNLIYARTDVGGVYRWEQATGTWTPLNDDLGLDDSQLTGVVSFAVDPTDDNRLYLAAGQYLPSWGRTAAILRSTDRGATWTRTELTIRLGGNSDGRGTGERLQVDPNKPSILFLGTNQNGLWKSTDSGVTWSQVSAFAPSSLTFVLFDQRSGGTGTATPTIYAGVNGTGPTLQRSTDGGATWSAVSGAPSNLIPNHADFDSAGLLYLSYADNVGPNNMSTGAVWKFNPGTSAWTNISPRTPGGSDTFGWGAVSVGKSTAGTLVATTNDRWNQGDEIWRSTDSGATWTNLNPLDTYDATSTPWALFHVSAAAFRPHWLTDVKIDPFDHNRVLFVTGGGIWGTDGAFGSAPAWTFRNNGLEETVPLELVSPPSGAPLLSAIGDIGGFRHDNLDATPPESNFYNPTNGTNIGLDFAQGVPATIVRTHSGTRRGGYSTNGGTTWTDFAATPSTATSNGPGEIAVNADATRIVWIPDNSAPYYSTDNGATWTASTGAPAGPFHPTSDRVNAAKFYLYDSNAGRAYVSTNGGQSFSSAGAVPSGGTTMRAVFGREGHLWAPTWSRGLYRSTDSGASFTAIPSVQEAYQVGFGMTASGQTHPAIFLWGKIGGVVGLFRSDDTGSAWVRINDAAHQYGWINAVTGDPRTYGRVYLATGGRGIIYGSLPGANNPPDVAISSPAGGASFTAGDTISIAATATDSNGTVASVAFYRGATLISTDTSAPFSASWTSPAEGTYTLTAIATDNDGATATSTGVNITVSAGTAPPPPAPAPTPSGGGGGGGGALADWFVAALAALCLLRRSSLRK